MSITNPSRQTINTTVTVSPGATPAQGAKADTALQPEDLFYSIALTSADPTGVADTRTIIQAAIDANYGKTLFIPSGTYKLSKGSGNFALRILNSINIVCDPNTIFMLDSATGNNVTSMIYIGDGTTAVNNVSWFGGSLDGNASAIGGSYSTGGTGVYGHGPITNISFRGTKIHNQLGGGVVVEGQSPSSRAKRLQFLECIVDDIAEGVRFQNCDRFDWIGGSITNATSQDLFEPHGAVNGWSLQRCYLAIPHVSNSAVEIFAQDRGDILNGLIADCEIIDNEVRISLGSGLLDTNFEVNGVVIERCKFTNSQIYSGTGKMQNILVRDCVFDGPSNDPKGIPSPKTAIYAQKNNAKFSITCVADVSDSLNSKYFDVWDGSVSGTENVRVWLNTNSGTAPAVPYRGRLLEITTTTNASATTVATALAAALHAQTQFDATSSGAVVTVTMAGSNVGYTLPADVNTTFAFAEIYHGNQNFIVENCVVRNYAGAGIQSSVKDTHVKHCRFKNNGTAGIASPNAQLYTQVILEGAFSDISDCVIEKTDLIHANRKLLRLVGREVSAMRCHGIGGVIGNCYDFGFTGSARSIIRLSNNSGSLINRDTFKVTMLSGTTTLLVDVRRFYTHLMANFYGREYVTARVAVPSSTAPNIWVTHGSTGDVTLNVASALGANTDVLVEVNCDQPRYQ